MKRAYRKPGALGVVMGILAGMVFGIGSFRIAEGHMGGDGTFHVPEAPQNLRVTGIAGSSSNAAVVSWDAGHGHSGNRNRFGFIPHIPFAPSGVMIVLSTKQGIPRIIHSTRGISRNPCPGESRCIYGSSSPGSHTEIISGLLREEIYYVYAATMYSLDRSGPTRFSGWVAATITTFGTDIPEPETPNTPDPETPDPETPTTPDPETPDPVTPGCSYKHRLIGVPGATGAGYTGQILISSEDSKATVNIRAYQKDNGAPIDVLDSEGSAIGSSVSLSPANSVKQFRLEEIRGWHIVIVEHPSKAAMEDATVAMRLREPDTGVSIELAERIEQCTTAATTAE